MKKLVLLFLPLLFPCLLLAQTEPANYKVAASEFTDLYNKGDAEHIFAMFDAKMQSALPLETTKKTITQLKQQLGAIKATEFKGMVGSMANYKTAFTNAVVSLKIGLDNQGKMNALLVQPYQEKTGYKISPDLTETTVKVNAPEAALSGSLIMPAKNSIEKVPVVLIIAGSGPTDRNGNNGSVITGSSYLKLADALGKAGIATLLYDKRAVGASRTTKAMNETHFEDLTNDAAAMVQYLKANPKFSKVIVLGHSEGSLIGMLVAGKEKADAFVSLAGAGEAAQKILAVQFKSLPADQYKANMGKLDSLSKGLNVKASANDLLFSPILQPYMISWFKYDPQQEIKKLKVPVLIVQGTTDFQVAVSNAENLKKAKPDAQLVLIKGMNHALVQAPENMEQNMAAYSNATLPVDAGLVSSITQFVVKLK